MAKGKYLKQEKLSTGKKIGRVILIILLIIILLLGAVFAFIWSKLGKITYDHGSLNETAAPTVDHSIQGTLPPDPTDVYIDPTDIPEESEPAETVDVSNLVMETAPSYSQGELFRDKDVMNILLVGTDERSWGFSTNARGDINILVSINKAEKTVKLVSFSRGIAIKMLDGPYKGKYEWLTSAHNFAGTIAVMQEMENSFKIELDRYVRVNFHTATEVVDAIGGIDMDLTAKEAKTMSRYFKVDFVEGKNRLDGDQALYYARLRHVDDDWGRIERQRRCILAVVNKLKGSSFSTLNDLCDQVMPMIQTNLTKREIAELILYSPKFLESEFGQMTIPIANSYGGMKCYSGVSGWALNYEKNNAALHEFLFGTTSAE